MSSIIILDYGVGNIGNLKYAFEKLGFKAHLTSDPSAVDQADLVVLPGVGAFGDAMEKLRESGLDQLILKRAKADKLVLGICLGMQVLCEGSEENGLEQGLGWFKGQLVRFPETLRVPHMGWNTLTFTPEYLTWGSTRVKGATGLTEPYVYFVHSYRLMGFAPEDLVAYSDYDGPVPAIVQRGSVTGFQFHPEKSGPYGLGLLENYLRDNHFCTDRMGSSMMND